MHFMQLRNNYKYSYNYAVLIMHGYIFLTSRTKTTPPKEDLNERTYSYINDLIYYYGLYYVYI